MSEIRKREYLGDKIDEIATSTKNNNIVGTYHTCLANAKQPSYRK
jgi:hypothetical protein